MSNKIVLERATTKKEPMVYISASDALSSHIAKADEKCTGTNDDEVIQGVIDDLYYDKGNILLSEGTFNLSDTLDIDYNRLTIQGMGRQTEVVMGSEGTVAIDATGTQHTTIKDLLLQMPTTDGADGIVTGTVPHIKNVRLQGGDTTNWLIKCVQSFNMDIENITAQGAIGNGIFFEHEGTTYPGNGKVDNIQFSMARNSTGIKLDSNYNLMTLSNINIVTSAGYGEGNGITGIYIGDGAKNILWDEIDLELMDYGIYVGKGCEGHHFTRTYLNSLIDDIYLDTTTKNNIFISYRTSSTNWNITDLGSRNLSERNRFVNGNRYHLESQPPTFCEDFDGANLSHVWDGSPALSNGWATLTTGTITGNSSKLDFGGNGGYKDAYETFMETKLKRVSSGDYDVRFGLRNTGWASTNNSSYFRALNTDENWVAVVTNGSTETTTDTGIAIDTVAHTFKTVKWNTGTSMLFFIDDALVASMHNSPQTTSPREPCFEIITQEDAAKSLSIDYVLLQQGRALTP